MTPWPSSASTCTPLPWPPPGTIPTVRATWKRSILRLLAKDPSSGPRTRRRCSRRWKLWTWGPLTKPAEPQSLDSLAGGVFVGRQREMGELKAALEEALAGHGRLVMLVGEPGIGKTRTALELATYAGLRRAQVLWGRCYESPGAPPYWPWVQAIRAYVRDAPGRAVRAEMGSGAAEIAQIVSEVRQRLPDVPPPPTVDDPESARFRLFDAVTTFLKSAAQAQPLVLILDDLALGGQALAAPVAVPGGRAGREPAAGARLLPRRGALAQASPGPGAGRS